MVLTFLPFVFAAVGGLALSEAKDDGLQSDFIHHPSSVIRYRFVFLFP
jgi:hypothetical protein